MSISQRKNNPIKLTQSTNHLRSTYSEKLKVKLDFPTNSRWTKQSFKEECDINNVMARYQSTGEMPVINQTAPQYLDATQNDYQSAMEFVAGAKTLFQELPSELRNRFKNDPGEFLEYTSQEKNRPEMAAMGLLRPANEWVGVTPQGIPPNPLKINPSEFPSVSEKVPAGTPA